MNEETYIVLCVAKKEQEKDWSFMSLVGVQPYLRLVKGTNLYTFWAEYGSKVMSVSHPDLVSVADVFYRNHPSHPPSHVHCAACDSPTSVRPIPEIALYSPPRLNCPGTMYTQKHQRWWYGLQ